MQSALTLGEIATFLGATRLDPGIAGLEIGNARGLSEADENSLSYVEDARQLEAAASRTVARALLVPLGTTHCARPCIPLKNPRLGFARVLRLLHPDKRYIAGTHPTAEVHAGARVDPTAHIGPWCRVDDGVELAASAVLHAHVHVGRNSRIGARSELRPRVYIGENVDIGRDCLIHASTVIGPPSSQPAAKESSVFIGDEVEFGARALIEGGQTVIGGGTRTDNMIRVGAGATLGPHCLLVSCSQVGPRAVLEHHVTVAGQGLILDGVRVGAIVIVGARGKVDHDLAPGSIVSGDPAVPHKEELKRIANTMRLARLADEMERVLNLAP